MKNEEILRRAVELAEAGEPFALATVVAREAPSSARAGDRALIEADGTLRGWLGGACIEPTIRREAENALADGEPRLVVFAPDGDADRPGAVVHPMTCHSGGTVEVHVEPELPSPALILYGDSPVCRALAAMAPAAGYRVRAVGVGGDAAAYGDVEVVERGEAAPGAGASPGDGPGTAGTPGATPDVFAVVATMGEWDLEAVREALASGARYVGLVASPRRAGAVRERLEAAGVDPGGRLVSPAGLDLGAREPGEIAVTILAELVEVRRGAAEERSASGSPADRGRTASPEVAPPGAADAVDDPASGSRPGRADAGRGAGGGSDPEAGREESTDPVCGMTVSPGDDPPTAEHDGVVYRFCCAGCRERFVDDPARYVPAGET